MTFEDISCCRRGCRVQRVISHHGKWLATASSIFLSPHRPPWGSWVMRTATSWYLWKLSQEWRHPVSSQKVLKVSGTMWSHCIWSALQILGRVEKSKTKCEQTAKKKSKRRRREQPNTQRGRREAGKKSAAVFVADIPVAILTARVRLITSNYEGNCHRCCNTPKLHLRVALVAINKDRNRQKHIMTHMNQ